MTDKDPQPCPSLSGKFTAYAVEARRNNKDTWRSAYRRVEQDGVLGPRMFSGVINDLSLLGYDQAMAIAWALKADCSAHNAKLQIQIVSYDVTFDMKAYKRDKPKRLPTR